MSKYIEDKKSVLLYKMNRKLLLFEKAPYLIDEKNAYEKISGFIYKIMYWIRNNLLERKLFEKRNIQEDEYPMDEIINYHGELPRVAIYTCVIGGYDSLVDPLYVNDKCDYFVITDDMTRDYGVWKKINVNSILDISRMESNEVNRYIKTHPHEIFKEYNVSVYVDGNIMLVSDVVPLVLKMKNNFIGVHLHQYRETIKAEREAIIAYKRKVDRKKLDMQIIDYYSNGYRDDNKLLENTVIIRKHNDLKCIRLMESWWNEMRKYTFRDQISLPYVMWKEGLTLSDIYIMGHNLNLNPRFRRNKHIF